MAEIRNTISSGGRRVPLSPSEELALAKTIATKAHAGGKLGEPYIRHWERVSDAVKSDQAKAVALLHEVIEKALGWTPERLRDCGFSPEVVAAVKTLTWRLDETKDACAVRASANPLSLEVKLADLRDNLAQVGEKGKSGAEYRHRLRLLENAASHVSLRSDPRRR